MALWQIRFMASHDSSGKHVEPSRCAVRLFGRHLNNMPLGGGQASNFFSSQKQSDSLLLQMVADKSDRSALDGTVAVLLQDQIYRASDCMLQSMTEFADMHAFDSGFALLPPCSDSALHCAADEGCR
jgi:hypothetical protein